MQKLVALLSAALEYGLEKTPLLHVSNKSRREGEVVLHLCASLVLNGEASTCAVSSIKWREDTSWAQAQHWILLLQNVEKKIPLIAASVEGQGRGLSPRSLNQRGVLTTRFQSCVVSASLPPP